MTTDPTNPTDPPDPTNPTRPTDPTWPGQLGGSTAPDRQSPADPAGYQQPAQPAATSGKRLVRRSEGKMVAGVCTGVADYLGVDVTLVRVVAVLGTIFGLGSLVLAYLVAWALVPEE